MILTTLLNTFAPHIVRKDKDWIGGIIARFNQLTEEQNERLGRAFLADILIEQTRDCTDTVSLFIGWALNHVVSPNALGGALGEKIAREMSATCLDAADCETGEDHRIQANQRSLLLVGYAAYPTAENLEAFTRTVVKDDVCWIYEFIFQASDWGKRLESEKEDFYKHITNWN